MAGAIGVVLFDDPKRVGPGWAARAGEAARRIEGTGDLSTSVAWITNMDFMAMRRSGLIDSPRFRDDSFLRLQLQVIRSELGLAGDEHDEEAAAVLAEVAGNVMQICSRYGLRGREVPQRSLTSAFALSLLSTFDRTVQSEQARAVLQAGTQTYVFTERQPPSASHRQFSVHRHRTRHALDLLAMPVPEGRWRLASFDELPRDVEQLIAFERPLMARIEIHRLDNRMAPIISYGAKGGAGEPRKWVPQHELRLLNQLGDIEICEVMLCERFAPLPIRIEDFTARDDLSYSTGVALDNLWHSVMRDQNNRVAHSGPAIWLQATDRILLIREIRRMIANNPTIMISGYGHGRVNGKMEMRSEEGWGIDLMEAVDDSPLIPQMNPYRSGPEARLQPGASPLAIMQQMMLRGQRALLLETDRRLLPRISGSIKPGASPWVRTAPASAQPADELDEIEPIKAPAPEPKPHPRRLGDLPGAEFHPEPEHQLAAIPGIDEIHDE